MSSQVRWRSLKDFPIGSKGRVGHSIGRQAMLACNVIPQLADLFNDQEPSVRRNAHKAVSMYSEAPPGN